MAPLPPDNSEAAAVTIPAEDDESTVSNQLPIRFISKCCKGFGRGSTDLGIPTANVSKDDASCTMVVDSLPTGIYWGYARIGDSGSSSSSSGGATEGSLGRTFITAVSIGYNPTYGNEEKTIEPHLIAPTDHPKRYSSSCKETLFQDFYGETIRLSVVGYLRPELPFEGLEKLTQAIKKDIADAERLGGSLEDELAARERRWVEGTDTSVQIS
jgi:riboflavin kinase